MFNVNACYCLSVNKRDDFPAESLFDELGFPSRRYRVGELPTDDSEAWKSIRHSGAIDIPHRSQLGGVWEGRLPSFNAFLAFRHIIQIAGCLSWTGSVLLLEDDACPVADAKEILQAAHNELVMLEDSGMESPGLIYLGANHTWARTKQISPHLLLVQGSVCFHAVIVQRKAFLPLLRLPLNGPIDLMATQLHTQMPCLAVWPTAVIQTPGMSHCDGKYQDYSHYWSNKGEPF